MNRPVYFSLCKELGERLTLGDLYRANRGGLVWLTWGVLRVLLKMPAGVPQRKYLLLGVSIQFSSAVTGGAVMSVLDVVPPSRLPFEPIWASLEMDMD